MLSRLNFDATLAEKFQFTVLQAKIENIKVEKENPELEKFKEELVAEVRKNYSIEKIKDDPLIRLYRDFYWRLDIDPTKIRPAAEALIRRILSGSTIPKINTLVDAYNCASIKMKIPLAAFDEGKLKGELILRRGMENEKFLGIGMKEPSILKGNEIVIADKEKPIAIYPYRDSDATKVVLETKAIRLLICGVPGVEENYLTETKNVAVEHITRFCNTSL